jgi:hypothetical protein
MSEETEDKGGFFSNLKNQIITGIGVILTTLGTVFMDEVKSLVGLGDETEQVQGVQQNNQQSQQNNQNQSVIINIPEQKPAETRTIIKEVPGKSSTQPAAAPPKKKEKEDVDW